MLAALALTASAAIPAVLAQDESAPRTRRVVPLRRLMPLGDSITQGGDGFASWRYPLWFGLPSELPFDFVGRRNTVFPTDEPGNPDLALYPEYAGTFDRDHEAWWGARSDHLARLVFRASESARPDVVLVHVGTNDVGQRGAEGLDNLRTHLPRILDGVRAARPAAQFFLAQVIPIGRGNAFSRNAELVPALNAEIAAIAAAESRAASPIVLVDHFTGFDVEEDLQPDGLHPNAAGEEHVAATWRAALLARGWPGLPPRHVAALVLDPSFEALALADLAVVEQPPGGAWRSGGSAHTFRGIYNPGADTYLDAAGAGTPRGAEGDEVAYLYEAGTGEDAMALFQTLATTCELGKTYELTVAVGQRLATNPYGPSTYGGFRLELLAGNEVVAASADSVVPPPGEFRDARVSFVANPLPLRLRRRALSVRLRLSAAAQGSATDFDHVRLVVR